MTEIRKEIAEVQQECEQNKQEITQAKEDVNARINNIEEIRMRQLESVELRQAGLALTHKTLGERCEGLNTTVNAVKDQVNSDKERLTEQQQREFNNLRDEINNIRTYPITMTGIPHVDSRGSIDFRTCLLYTSRCV